MTAARATTPRAPERYGVWLFGARGGLATTIAVGARAVAHGLTPPTGLLTAQSPYADLDLVEIAGLEFGGHEVRDVALADAAAEIRDRAGTIPAALLADERMRGDLAAQDAALRPGCLVNAGPTIETMIAGERGFAEAAADRPLREHVERLRDDIRDFVRRNDLAGVVCVLLTSTEPALATGPEHASLAALDAALDADRRDVVRPSLLYAYVAGSLGYPLIHFTPSNAALVPAVRELFERERAPYMGSDGKTGETLVKSALAPMFRLRALRVLSWQGYNMLGDRDGAVLAGEDNKRAKVESKDGLLASILGYTPHTHVGIDYVPSLDDLKTAWDFIHFEGFLGHRMSMQFTWQGADAILAAPLILDMVRMTELAARRGETGPMRWLASFFKRPLDVDEQDLHAQAAMLQAWAERARAGT